MECDWCTGNNPVDNITALSNTAETKPMSDESKLIPVLEEDNIDNEFGIAEFESNRASSPENDAMINEPDHTQTINDNNQNNHLSDNDQLAYKLADDSNGPWTNPAEDEQSAQLFREVDPELDMYQEQYNIVVTMMVGGQLAMGRNNFPDNDQDHNDMNSIDQQTAMDEQLHDVAAQDKAVRFPIETSNVTRTTDETTPVAKGAPNEEESQDEQIQNVQMSTAPWYN
ncbi:hypothetical protein IW262DRAFT_1300559 [Armillaria fumosa]|nr:hypothetical protein IW262DRAFT_1300559 [Armillaria fumosa]